MAGLVNQRTDSPASWAGKPSFSLLWVPDQTIPLLSPTVQRLPHEQSSVTPAGSDTVDMRLKGSAPGLSSVQIQSRSGRSPRFLCGGGVRLRLLGVGAPPAGRPTVNSSSSAFLLWEPQGSVPAYPSHKTSPTQEPRHLTLAPSALTSGSSRGQRPAGLLSVLAPACWVSKDEGNASLCPGELGALRTWQGASGGPAPRGSGHVGFRRPGTLFGLLS